MRTITTVIIKADLNGTTLSHTTSPRQGYDMNCFLWIKRSSVVSLRYATKSYHVNRDLRNRQIITYLVIFLQRTFSKMSKSTNKARKHIITLFLFSRTQLSSWRYKTGAKPCNRFHLSRTQMSALAVRLGSCGHSNKSKHAKISFPWLDKPLWTIAPTTCDFSLET